MTVPTNPHQFRVVTITMLWSALPDDEAEDIAARLGKELQDAGYASELLGITVSSPQPAAAA